MSRRISHQHIIHFTNQNDAIDHIKWCRRNLGERGTDWDFSGSTNLHIMIYNPKHILFYKLKFD